MAPVRRQLLRHRIALDGVEGRLRQRQVFVTAQAPAAAAAHEEAAGLEHPDQLGPEHILRRVSPVEVRSLAALYPFLKPGELLEDGESTDHAVFREFWDVARSDSFVPPEKVRARVTSTSWPIATRYGAT